MCAAEGRKLQCEEEAGALPINVLPLLTWTRLLPARLIPAVCMCKRRLLMYSSGGGEHFYIFYTPSTRRIPPNQAFCTRPQHLSSISTLPLCLPYAAPAQPSPLPVVPPPPSPFSANRGGALSRDASRMAARYWLPLLIYKLRAGCGRIFSVVVCGGDGSALFLVDFVANRW